MACEDLAREALEPFAREAEGWRDTIPDHVQMSAFNITLGDLRRARTAYDAIGSGVKADETGEGLFLIRKRGAYYQPNGQGYTRIVEEAGRYTLKEAEAITHPNGPDGPRDGMDYVPAPATEKAAPIPAEVLDAAAAEVLDILNREAILFPICAKSKRLAARVARVSIMQDRAARASQEERIREDERKVDALALAFKARSFARWLRDGNAADVRPEPDDYDELAGMIERLWRERVDALAALARLRGGAS